MAEEKKEKTTKKSSGETKVGEKKVTTKKKEEEVKMEKKFCTKCGKELEANEICSCSDKTSEPVSINTDALKNIGKSFLNKIINMYKKPFTTLKEERENKEIKGSIIMLSAIAISFALYIIAVLSTTMSNINSGSYTFNANNIVEIPYFKIFIYMVLIYFVISFIPILVSLAAAKITGNKNFDFKKSTNLYVTSMAPTVLTNLIMAILFYLNILTWLGAIAGCIISTACFFHYILGFLNSTEIDENKKSYTLTGIIISWVVVAIVVIALVIGSVFSDLYNNNTNNRHDNYSDYFNW